MSSIRSGTHLTVQKYSDEVKKRQELKPLEKDPRVAVLEASLEANSLVPATFTSPAQTLKSKRGEFLKLIIFKSKFNH